MNNIDILEELVNGFDNLISYKQKQAIKTLIAENKELKEKNKRQQENLKITNKKIAAQRGQLMMLNKAYIPKSKVEEVINNNKPHIAQEKLQSLLGKE